MTEPDNASLPRPLVSLIAAVARNGAIGKDNALLWKLPGDMRHFRETTAGAPIIMGRKTWESIGRPLPGRRNIVVTRHAEWRAPGADTAGSLNEALVLAASTAARKAFVIGGAQIYAEAMSLADELVITEIDADFDGDTWFPARDESRFKEVSRSDTFDENGLSYRFVTYRRRP